ncbi:MAG TPA: site-specific integrase [Allosphingosinicella sp.]|nr:site-specific integrase [Allosphingosinicella sp.]
MTRLNPENERLKRRYIRYLEQADGLAPITIDNALRAVVAFEHFTNGRDFGKLRDKDAHAYKMHLLEGKDGRAANRATVQGKLKPVQRFFRWLAEQDGYRNKIRYGDVKFFNLSRNDQQIARDHRVKPTPELEQVLKVVRAMQATTDVELRDRAIICCALLTCPRVSALITLKLKHVRQDRLGIDQDGREVHTKFGKSFTSFFFPVGDDIRDMFLDYVDHLRTLGWDDDDPLFPQTERAIAAVREGRPLRLIRKHWATPDPIRAIFRRALAAGGMPYYTPHSLRRTIARFGMSLCNSADKIKAWSQNLAHQDVLTTFTNYGSLTPEKQGEIILSMNSAEATDEQALDALFDLLKTDPRFRAKMEK